MSNVSPPVADGLIQSRRSPLPWMIWCGLAGLVLSAVGVLAMPSLPMSGDRAQAGRGAAVSDAGAASGRIAGLDGADEEDPTVEPVEMAAVVPGDADRASDAIEMAAPPSVRELPAEDGDPSDDRRIDSLYRLVNEVCGAAPRRIVAGFDALTIDLPLARSDDPCLDDVALEFDREHPGAPQLLFDVLAAEEERGLPVLHVSAMHTGPMPYIHLKNGKTLFVGAIVDGWELASIDESGAAFVHGDRTFTLRVTDDRSPS